MMQSRSGDWKSRRQKQADYFRKKSYGLTAQEMTVLWEAQKRSCAICKAPIKTTVGCTKVEQAHIDHDHITGKIRGLLCRHCNWLLGHARDSRKILRRAIAYLAYHGS